MFRIKKETSEYAAKSVRLPVEMIRQIQILADENNLSFNRVIIQCIEYALDNMENDTKEERSRSKKTDINAGM